MGGMGSGRRSERDLTADHRQLDVRALHRAGMLEPGHIGRWRWMRRGVERASIQIEAYEAALFLRYQVNRRGEVKPYSYAVHLDWTSCTFGGRRPWFLCPSCGQRVAILYGKQNFVCRHCRGLAYASQRETEGSRAIRRANAIRRRLGWIPGVLNPPGAKPKGMHWHTYVRLYNEYNELAQIGLEGIQHELGSVNAHLNHIEERLRHQNV